MSSVPFSLRLDPETRRRLDEEAERLDRSASYVAAKAIEGFLEARAAKRRALEEAVAEADKGVFVSSEAMARWMDSWDTDDELPPPEPDVFLGGRQS